MLKTERKTPVSDLEIGRRLAGYPPEFLLYMGLITKKECDRIKRRERHVADWYGYRRGVFQ